MPAGRLGGPRVGLAGAGWAGLGRVRRWGVDGGEQVVEGGLPGPVLGQAQRDVAAAVAGEPGRNVDQVAAQGGAAGLAVEGRGVQTVAARALSPRISTLLPWILVWPNPAPCLPGP